MTDPNAALIQRFYEAFQRSDAEAMAACYAPDVEFSDPVFGVLRGREAGDMWRMLISRATAATTLSAGLNQMSEGPRSRRRPESGRECLRVGLVVTLGFALYGGNGAGIFNNGT